MYPVSEIKYWIQLTYHTRSRQSHPRSRFWRHSAVCVLYNDPGPCTGKNHLDIYRQRLFLEDC